MEILFGGLGGIIVGGLASWKGKVSEDVSVIITSFTTAGAFALGFIYLMLSEKIVGTNFGLEWLLVGIIGGLIGLGLYKASALLEYFRPRTDEHVESEKLRH
jgi:hypothetical protein